MAVHPSLWVSILIRSSVSLIMLFVFSGSVGCSLSRDPSVMKVNGTSSALMKEGVEAFRKGDLEESKRIFTRIITFHRGSPDLEEAQFYLAKIVDKQGRLDEALQQYTFFFKNYPSSKHAFEVYERLSDLTKASVPPGESPLPPAPATPLLTDQPLNHKGQSDRYGHLTGGLTLEYLYDVQTHPKPSNPVQNRLSEFLDLRWKKSMAGSLKFYAAGMNAHNFENPEDKRYRLSKLFAEWNDSKAVLDLRIGRQPASGNNLFSRFDGLTLTVRPFKAIGIGSSVGYPVDTFDQKRIMIQHDRLFYETFLSLYDLYHLGGKLYYTEELTKDFATRRAAGLNGYWMNESVNITSIVDYDLDFRKYNNKLLGVEYRYSIAQFSAGVEYRRNPFLDYGSALFDPSLTSRNPPITSIDVLTETMTREEIRLLALANTTDSMEYRAGASVDFNTVWRGDLRYAHSTSQNLQFNLTNTRDKIRREADRYSVFLSERNGMGWSEGWTLLLLYSPATDSKLTTATTAITKYWGLGAQASLRYRWEQIEYLESGTESKRLIPGFTLSYSGGSGLSVSLEADYTMDTQLPSHSTIKTIQTRTSVTVPF